MKPEKKNSEQGGDMMNTWTCTRQGELYHHGIKGQKWGVRRFQNKDGSLTSAGKKRYKTEVRKDGSYIIKRGSEVHRVTADPELEKKGYAYISFMDADVIGYKKEMTGAIKNTRGSHVKTFDMTMKVKKDLVLPSEIEKAKTFVDIYSKHKIDSYDMYVMKKNSTDSSGELRGRARSLKDTLIKQGMNEKTADAYAMFSMCLYTNNDYKKVFFEALKAKGYNAIEDTEDSFSHRMKPVIVFERENTLKVKNIEEIPWGREKREQWMEILEAAKKANLETLKYHEKRGIK